MIHSALRRTILGLLLTPGVLLAAEPDEEAAAPAAAGEAETPSDEGEGFAFGLGWLDQTQAFASDRANTIAGQLDRFFGVPRSDLEAAYSSLRLTLQNSWNDIEGFETKVRLRGKVHLPRINERISLIFSEDEGEGTSYYARDGRGRSAEERESTKINLEYNLRDNDRHRIDFRVGLRSSLKARASMRYRYELPTGDFLNRFTQTAYFRDGDGFGSISRYQLERPIGDDGLLRWTNDVRFEESYTGSEWDSGLSYLKRQSDTTAVSYFARISGQTSPSYTSAMDLGVRYRMNVARPWLFIEVEPGYTWQQQEHNLPREHSPFLIVRFEMAIGRLDG